MSGDLEFVRASADGMIRNFGDDALGAAKAIGERQARNGGPGADVIWLAIAAEIQAQMKLAAE